MKRKVIQIIGGWCVTATAMIGVCVFFWCQEHVIVEIVNVNHMRELMSNYCDFQRHLFDLQQWWWVLLLFFVTKIKKQMRVQLILSVSLSHCVSLSISHVRLIVCVVPRLFEMKSKKQEHKAQSLLSIEPENMTRERASEWEQEQDRTAQSSNEQTKQNEIVREHNVRDPLSTRVIQFSNL